MSSQKAPRMHTAEHVLNQTMVRMFGCGRCFSAHVNPKKSKCDYRFERPLAPGEARELEARVNDALARDMAVSAEAVARDVAAREFDLGRLPDPDVDSVRIVRVGDYDACPCSGEHVARTSQVGAFRLVSHSFEDGMLRIRFRLDEPPKGPGGVDAASGDM
ncbi:alanyl-tRNA editing protein [Desulfocurvus sp. DL9XJH121]